MIISLLLCQSAICQIETGPEWLQGSIGDLSEHQARPNAPVSALIFAIHSVALFCWLSIQWQQSGAVATSILFYMHHLINIILSYLNHMDNNARQKYNIKWGIRKTE
jgi:hypothetical protein